MAKLEKSCLVAIKIYLFLDSRPHNLARTKHFDKSIRQAIEQIFASILMAKVKSNFALSLYLAHENSTVISKDKTAISIVVCGVGCEYDYGLPFVAVPVYTCCS